MSNSPTGSGKGIFGLLFREAGLFSEQAWTWANERAKEGQQWATERAKEGQQYLETSTREVRVLASESEKPRQADAEARLLEQMRLAKQAGLDVEGILKRFREGG